MYIATHHITIKFNGVLNYHFSFDVPTYSLRPEVVEEIAQVRSDGYLYLRGCRITNNKDGINTIYSCLINNHNEESYWDYVLSIDSNGYIIKTKSEHSNNQINRFFTKLFGK